MGHETIGLFHEVGSAVTNLAVGARVITPFNISCGTCHMCSLGMQSQCETTQVREKGPGASLFGFSELYCSVPGGQAECLRVPRPTTVPSRCVMTCPISNTSTCLTSCPQHGSAGLMPMCPTAEHWQFSAWALWGSLPQGRPGIRATGSSALIRFPSGVPWQSGMVWKLWITAPRLAIN